MLRLNLDALSVETFDAVLPAVPTPYPAGSVAPCVTFSAQACPCTEHCPDTETCAGERTCYGPCTWPECPQPL